MQRQIVILKRPILAINIHHLERAKHDIATTGRNSTENIVLATLTPGDIVRRPRDSRVIREIAERHDTPSGLDGGDGVGSDGAAVESICAFLRNRLQRLGIAGFPNDLSLADSSAIRAIDLARIYVRADETRIVLRNCNGKLTRYAESTLCNVDGGLEEVCPGKLAVFLMHHLPAAQLAWYTDC